MIKYVLTFVNRDIIFMFKEKLMTHNEFFFFPF